MLAYPGLPSYGAWEFVDTPDKYVIDKCDCICLLFCNHLESLLLDVYWTCLRPTKCIPLYKESPVDRGFVTEPKNIIKSICLLIVCYPNYLSNFVKKY